MSEARKYEIVTPITKSILAGKYGFSVKKLGQLLNERYFLILEPLGYQKQSIILPPLVVHKFFELYGEPLTENEI